MESLKRRWKKALRNPLWWLAIIVLFVWTLFLIAVCEGQVISKVSVYVKNLNERTHWVRLTSELQGPSKLIEVGAGETREVSLIEDEYLVCETRDTYTYLCRVEKATEGRVWEIRKRQ